jgi:hypothetical protein
MNMKKSFIWIISVLITIGAAMFQRLTGPTQPETYKLKSGDKYQRIHLPRSHGGTSDCVIKIFDPESSLKGFITFRRYPTEEPWDTIIMERKGEHLTGYLPSQPPAGKLEYSIIIDAGKESIKLNTQPIIIRFKGDVPGWILIPHILFIFAAMLFSTVTGFFAVFRYPSYKSFAWVTLILMVTGGLILGPIIQKFAFGEYWTGLPFGKDLTDNKILLAFIIWLIAVITNIKKQRPWLIVLASVVYLAINFVPHSLMGSELNYESGKVVTGGMFIWLIMINFRKSEPLDQCPD